MIAKQRRLFAAAVVAASCVFYTGRLPAQNAKLAAESLFQAAKQLMTEKKYTEACPKFAESQKLDPSPGTLLNLGRCYEALGKTASAWTEYKAAAVLAAQLGQKDREQGARDLAKALEGKLSKLTVTAPAVPGLVVKSDGVEMGAAMLGTAMFVDPGDHTIEAGAPGYETYSATVRVGPDGDSKTAAVPALVKKAEPTPTVTATANAAPTATALPTVTTTPTVAPTTVPTEGSNTLRTTSYVLMGVGVAGVAVGGVMGGLAAGDVSNAQNDSTLCPNKLCTPQGRQVINDASTKALVSSIALPVGIAAAGAGVVLFFISSPSDKKSGKTFRSVAISPFASPQGASVSIHGKF
ncbi:MAG: hypothetical protein IPK82_20670 [Polyangiaceae bacterium]|nr:hypothetical protein [Polyangiaceae bacterium]